jgi:hypothetical protein
MNGWDLNDEDTLIEISETYSHLIVQLMMAELQAGERKTPMVRREWAAAQMGLTVEILMEAVAKAAEIVDRREIEAMTPEELADMEREAETVTEFDKFILTMIDEVMEERDRENAEIEALNKLFAS